MTKSALYEQCKALGAINGYEFGGIDDGLPFWVKREYYPMSFGYKYKTMTLFLEDLEPRNFAYMAEHDLTRADDVVKKAQAKYRRKQKKAEKEITL